MKVIGKHRQSFRLIRSLAVITHALDLSGEELFLSGTYAKKRKTTKRIYDELLSTNLLHLAVAIRTNLYQNTLQLPEMNISHCGFLNLIIDGKEKTVRFSFKDVCDKIIHADEIYRQLFESRGSGRATTVINGSRKKGKEKWKLSVSIQLFCEAVLNWLDEVERKK